MEHLNNITDYDEHFVIDAKSHKIMHFIADEPAAGDESAEGDESIAGNETVSVKEPVTEVVQNEHHSEKITFKIPRYIEGHDMMLCDKVKIHFINISAKEISDRSKGVYLKR